jgi:8-oxo-dGTP pyrophosphatase MutT (NUDIX family)
VFRDGPTGTEVLMVQRGTTARFMAGAWVFPGGAVDAIDSGVEAAMATQGDVEEPMRPWVAAAVRELIEETQVWLTETPVLLHEPEPFLKDDAIYPRAFELGRRFDLNRLGYFANWITPSMVPIRFDTRFFAAAVEPDTRAFPDPSELDQAEWVRPEDALEHAASGRWVVPFPTLKTLEMFVGYPSAAAVMDHVDSLGVIPPVQPRMRVGADGRLEVVLPGEPGFDDLTDDGPDPELLERAARASAADGEHLPELDVARDEVGDAG